MTKSLYTVQTLKGLWDFRMFLRGKSPQQVNARGFQLVGELGENYLEDFSSLGRFKAYFSDSYSTNRASISISDVNTIRDVLNMPFT